MRLIATLVSSISFSANQSHLHFGSSVKKKSKTNHNDKGQFNSDSGCTSPKVHSVLPCVCPWLVFGRVPWGVLGSWPGGAESEGMTMEDQPSTTAALVQIFIGFYVADGYTPYHVTHTRTRNDSLQPSQMVQQPRAGWRGGKGVASQRCRPLWWVLSLRMDSTATPRGVKRGGGTVEEFNRP
ncbi:unnamed protein product [Arctogadus glacialis]